MVYACPYRRGLTEQKPPKIHFGHVDGEQLCLVEEQPRVDVK